MKVAFERKDARLLVYRGQIVMSSSELPYLQQLVAQLKEFRGQTVLEVGFGLGVSAGLIHDSLAPGRHHIIEVEESLYQDCARYCRGRRGMRAILGDFFHRPFRSRYQVVFYDPYDYDFSAEGSSEHYAGAMVERAHRVLVDGGVLCHPFFGDMPMPALPGFRLHYTGRYKGPPFLLWDNSKCREAQLGYYVRAADHSRPATRLHRG